jgi:hypothetical protein
MNAPQHDETKWPCRQKADLLRELFVSFVRAVLLAFMSCAMMFCGSNAIPTPELGDFFGNVA